MMAAGKSTRKPMGRPSTLPEPWLSLATAYGGVQRLAEACGVSERQLRRWGTGVRPGAMVRKAVNAMARRRGIAEPWPESEM